MRITVSIDNDAFRREVDALMKSRVRPAVTDALNASAEASQKALEQELTRAFDNRGRHGS